MRKRVIQLHDPITRLWGTHVVEDWDDEGGSWFQWTMGNFGCDCNRALFLLRALVRVSGEESVPDDINNGFIDRECGETIRAYFVEKNGNLTLIRY